MSNLADVIANAQRNVNGGLLPVKIWAEVIQLIAQTL